MKEDQILGSESLRLAEVLKKLETKDGKPRGSTDTAWQDDYDDDDR
ncbi:MAG: hypothetical protein IT416_02725 [Candidatus Pacebacteria bacterium]|nr:hypothetical protein [Candidatus Paceibacterota bacterium]